MKEELFWNVDEILNSSSEDELVQVFRHWMSRLDQVIDTSGEYIYTQYFTTWFG
jgi:hypothetical protein